jgi:hypothetical protein
MLRRAQPQGLDMTALAMTASNETGPLYLSELAKELRTTTRTAKAYCRRHDIPILRFSPRREAISRRDYDVLMQRAAESGAPK